VQWEGYVAERSSSQVYVQVVELDPGREIGWGSSVAQQLRDRAADIERGIVAASETIAASLGSLASVDGWELAEVSASFGVTLTAEAGVIVSKASAGATFDVSFGFKRMPARAVERASA
jgi:Trypsin-co-occurring domain 1